MLISTDAKLCARTICSWRAWIAVFGLEEFVKALLYVLLWKIQMGAEPLSTLASFRSAACMMVVVCGSENATNRTIIRTVIDVVENGDCGAGINGDGMAEFCIITIVTLAVEGQAMFEELLEHRKRLVEQVLALEGRAVHPGAATAHPAGDLRDCDDEARVAGRDQLLHRVGSVICVIFRETKFECRI
jgi:hypothetical protein